MSNIKSIKYVAQCCPVITLWEGLEYQSQHPFACQHCIVVHLHHDLSTLQSLEPRSWNISGNEQPLDVESNKREMEGSGRVSVLLLVTPFFYWETSLVT